jgi:CHAD domain-containing protein
MAKKRKLPWNLKKSAAENARGVLPILAHQYLRASKALSDDEQPSRKAMHRFRIETKRLRYTLELFRPCLGSSLDGRIESLRRIQQDLGEINDCKTTQRLLFGKKRPRSQESAQVRDFLNTRSAGKTAGLLKRVRAFRTPARLRWWTAFAARPKRMGKALASEKNSHDQDIKQEIKTETTA